MHVPFWKVHAPISRLGLMVCFETTAGCGTQACPMISTVWSSAIVTYTACLIFVSRSLYVELLIDLLVNFVKDSPSGRGSAQGRQSYPPRTICHQVRLYDISIISCSNASFEGIVSKAKLIAFHPQILPTALNTCRPYVSTTYPRHAWPPASLWPRAGTHSLCWRCVGGFCFKWVDGWTHQATLIPEKRPTLTPLLTKHRARWATPPHSRGRPVRRPAVLSVCQTSSVSAGGKGLDDGAAPVEIEPGWLGPAHFGRRC